MSSPIPIATDTLSRIQLVVTGAVQGVGFRPFVYRLARELGIVGSVCNEPRGVIIEAEAPASVLDTFIKRLQREKPRAASIRNIGRTAIATCGATRGEPGFTIIPSSTAGVPRVDILPDLASCDACIEEAFNASDRRYRYPFTSCTECGPRWSIITGLPYDRHNTTMDRFVFCPHCRHEYGDPNSRRFHHQANACPVCGPQLTLYDNHRNPVAEKDDALQQAVDAVNAGLIVTLKGLGGFQLLVDAGNAAAVERLRARKQRPGKPLAVMCASLEQLQRVCEANDAEQALLRSAAAPIVLLKKKTGQQLIAEPVAPGNRYLGVMLPTTVLHHLLLAAAGRPLVVTSGNTSGEPICTGDDDAFARLGHIADLFLSHDRPIARPLDDSVAQVVQGKPMLLRRARGYAPAPIELPGLPATAPTRLATGGYLKNTVAINMEERVLLSAHIGDLDNLVSRQVFAQRIQNLCEVYHMQPVEIVHDAHPDYPSTQYARDSGVRTRAVQHHHAHIAACMAEHGLNETVLGVAWDGTGLGDDNTAWGGEFLSADYAGYRRLAALLPFPLIGGDKSASDPRRAALGVLWTLHGGDRWALSDAALMQQFGQQEQGILLSMLHKRINTPGTSSAGRLFDAAACLLGVCYQNRFEGEAAMQLQFAAEAAGAGDSIHIPLIQQADMEWLDWRPLIRHLIEAGLSGTPAGELAFCFHRSLADAIVRVCLRHEHPVVVLSGGCFQNRLLLSLAIQALEANNIRVYWPQAVPANDGGIAFGQLAIGQLSSRQP